MAFVEKGTTKEAEILGAIVDSPIIRERVREDDSTECQQCFNKFSFSRKKVCMYLRASTMAVACVVVCMVLRPWWVGGGGECVIYCVRVRLRVVCCAVWLNRLVCAFVLGWACLVGFIIYLP